MLKSASLLVVVAIVAGTTGALSADTNLRRPSITLTLVEPNGEPFANAPAAVYLEPYGPPARYRPALLARGTTDKRGRFQFDLSDNHTARREAQKTEDGIVNILVISVNRSRTRRIHWDMSVPVSSGGFERTVRANLREKPAWTRGMASSAVVQAAPVELDVAPPASSSRKVRRSWRASGGSSSAAHDESLEAGAGDGKKKRLVKVVNQSLAWGMTGTFEYKEGRGTRTQVAYKICALDCDTYKVGGNVVELTSRGDSFSDTHKGNFHQTWRMEYEYRRYKTCAQPIRGGCGKRKYTWKPYGWTWGKNSKLFYSRPPLDREDAVRLRQGETFTRSEGDGETFSLGVSLFGLGLDSEADYSSITTLSWTTNKKCRKGRKYLYGEFSKPGFAKTVNAAAYDCL